MSIITKRMLYAAVSYTLVYKNTLSTIRTTMELFILLEKDREIPVLPYTHLGLWEHLTKTI